MNIFNTKTKCLLYWVMHNTSSIKSLDLIIATEMVDHHCKLIYLYKYVINSTDTLKGVQKTN